jgi:hypothetical protein
MRSRHTDRAAVVRPDADPTIDGANGVGAIVVSLGKGHLLDHAGGANRNRRSV